MSCCHRRVERFLDILVQVAEGPARLDPAARRVLTVEQIASMGRELAVRRGVDPGRRAATLSRA